MFCTKCGNDVKDGSAFCTSCGAPINQAPVEEAPVVEAAPVVNDVNEPVVEAADKIDSGTASFLDAIVLLFKNYANFTGRTTKSEFWWAFLFLWILNLAVAYIPGVGGVISVLVLIPNLALCVRRLHDIGRSWVSLLLGLIPLVGLIILIVLYCKNSDGDNKWGAAR